LTAPAVIRPGICQTHNRIVNFTDVSDEQCRVRVSASIILSVPESDRVLMRLNCMTEKGKRFAASWKMIGGARGILRLGNETNHIEYS
jgi:hypothetical protein